MTWARRPLRSSTPGELESKLDLLEMLLSKAPIGLGFVDRDLRRVWVNETLAAYNGLTVQEQVGQTMPELVPALWPQLEPLYRRALDDGEAVLDVDVCGSNEAEPDIVRHWRNSYYPVRLDGEVVGVGVVALDITELKSAAVAQQHLVAVVENCGEAVFGSTLDGVATSWNAAAQRLFGYTADEVIGQPLSLLAPEEPDARLQGAMRSRVAETRRAERYEGKRRRKDGRLVDVLITASPSISAAGEVDGIAVIAQDITDRMQAQHELAESERRLSEAQRIARIGSFDVDLPSGRVTWSDELRRILGVSAMLEPSVEKIFSMVHPADQNLLADGRDGAVECGIPFDAVYRMIRDDDSQRWVHALGQPFPAEPGRVVRLAGTLEDITEKVEAERVRRDAEQRFEVAFEQAGVGAAIIDIDGVRTRVNAAACAILGRPREDLLGTSWQDNLHPDEPVLGDAFRARGITNGGTYSDERRYCRPDGSVVWVLMHVAVVRDESGIPEYYLTQIQDITERKNAEADLAHLALHDPMTGLANRALLSDRLERALLAAPRRNADVAVVFLDIDQFKVINDSLGHTIGDGLLRRVAARIIATVRANDTVARFGGDEFVVVCDETSVCEVTQIASRILIAVSQPYEIDDHEITITASLGVAVADRHASAETLLRDADAAMYSAKELGRNRIEVFEASLRAAAEERLATATSLRRALKNNEFIVYYQPVVDLDTGAIVSAEALLRWQHPDRGLLSPAEFISVAEDTGLVVPIGTWVLEQACHQLAVWQRDDPSMTLAVNLSVRQLLAPDVVETIDETLKRSGAPARALHLELTESVLMGDVNYFEKTLTAIKDLGPHLSIDDFGTGYSSLSYLKRFPVDSVKIDRTFVDGLGADRHSTTLVSAIIAMAGALDMSVVAEGIETADQLRALRELHCHRGQGYYFAKPLPVEVMTELIRSGQRWAVA